ncbi:MAG: MoxR family ATPase [Armatimonadota bacterium]|nr:MAG: MoxR family ATPase [Armatimonadota bacterium]
MPTPADIAKRLTGNIEQVIVGKSEAVLLAVIALLADGHLLIDDVPGVAKTMLARSLALSIGATFRRIQCTPDLLPSDITGLSIFNQKTSEFEFNPGPVMSNIVLGDEINRAPPRTQSALLEAMAERQVTVDGVTHTLARPFCVIATQNPIEYEGTFPLPEAQLDRFLLRMTIGYPAADAEREILLRLQLSHPVERVQQVVTTEELLAAQQQVRQIFVHEKVRDYVVRLVQATRSHADVALGASPRGSLGLLRCAQAQAACDGLSFILPDQAKALLVPALAHRLILTPEARLAGRTAQSVLQRISEQVEAPVGEAYAREERS